jgi:hypothetical protein
VTIFALQGDYFEEKKWTNFVFEDFFGHFFKFRNLDLDIIQVLNYMKES